MNNAGPNSDLLTALRNLTLADLDRKLAELDAERAQLVSLRRSFVAREKTKRRNDRANRAREGVANA